MRAVIDSANKIIASKQFVFVAKLPSKILNAERKIFVRRLFLMVPTILLLLLLGCTTSTASDDFANDVEPSAPTQKENEKLAEETQFLRKLRELILSPPITQEKVESAFGWKVAGENGDQYGQYIYFDLYSKETWANPLLRKAKNGTTDLSIQFSYGTLCIPSEAVLAVFGRDFKPTVLNVDSFEKTPLPQKEESDVVKNNIKLFIYGPRYKIGNPTTTDIDFEYFYSECLRSVFVVQFDK